MYLKGRFKINNLYHTLTVGTNERKTVLKDTEFKTRYTTFVVMLDLIQYMSGDHSLRYR